MRLNILPFFPALLFPGAKAKSSSSLGCPDISESLREVRLAFEDAGLPNVTKITFEPQALLHILWAPPRPGDDPVLSYPGRHLWDNSTVPLPTFSATGLSNEQRGPFAIVMFDPDVAPADRPALRDFIGIDYYVSPGGSVLRNYTDAIVAWHRPTPPRHSHPERYIFFMFNQPEEFNRTNLDNTTNRNFDVADFALKYNLGNPIAGSFVYVENNASCWRENCPTTVK